MVFLHEKQFIDLYYFQMIFNNFSLLYIEDIIGLIE